MSEGEDDLVKVRALKTGYMFHKRIYAGEVFNVKRSQLSLDRLIEVKDGKTGEIVKKNHKGWMQIIEDETPVTNHKKKPDPYDRTPLAHEFEVV